MADKTSPGVSKALRDAAIACAVAAQRNAEHGNSPEPFANSARLLTEAYVSIRPSGTES
jgi:hypothetical protein